MMKSQQQERVTRLAHVHNVDQRSKRINILLPRSPADAAQGKQSREIMKSQQQERVTRLARVHNVDPVYTLYFGPHCNKQARWMPAIITKRKRTCTMNVCIFLENVSGVVTLTKCNLDTFLQRIQNCEWRSMAVQVQGSMEFLPKIKVLRRKSSHHHLLDIVQGIQTIYVQ